MNESLCPQKHLTSLDFVKTVLKYCKNKSLFVVDKGFWYNSVFEKFGLEYVHESFGKRNKVKSVFSSYKQRIKAFFKNFNINFRKKIEKRE